MKTPNLYLCAACVSVALLVLQVTFRPSTALAQTPPAPTVPENAAIATVISELAAQQKQMIANQDEIERKMAILQEDIRQARILARRGGGNGTAQ